MKDPRTPGGGAGGRESVAQAARHAHRTSDALPSDDSAPDRQPTLFEDPPTDDDVMAGRELAVCGLDDWWTATALQAIRAIAKTGREFQAFDLVELGVPEPDHPNRWGALLTRASRDGLIVATGAAPSRRPRTARSLTRTWRGAS